VSVKIFEQRERECSYDYKTMITTNLIYTFSQTVIDSSKRKSKKTGVKNKKDPEEEMIIEEYEGYCEECAVTDQAPKCSICG